MSTKISIAISLIATLVGTGLPAFAQDSHDPLPSDQQQLIQKLTEAKARDESQQKGYTAMDPTIWEDFNVQEAQIDRLIERIRSGHQVPPDEINRALQPPAN
jgi:hypothetical protein